MDSKIEKNMAQKWTKDWSKMDINCIKNEAKMEQEVRNGQNDQIMAKISKNCVHVVYESPLDQWQLYCKRSKLLWCKLFDTRRSRHHSSKYFGP